LYKTADFYAQHSGVFKTQSIQIKNNGHFFRFKSKIMAFIFDLDKKPFLLCGIMHAFEFKWSPKKSAKFPQTFLDAYPNSEVQQIHQQNFWEFVGWEATD
jgi:hypothetical protein